jgi:hypothetical protein
MWPSALADFSASLLPVKAVGGGSFCSDDDWLTGSLPTYLSPFVDDPTDDEEDVDELEGSGMLVVVVVVDADGGVISRLAVVVVDDVFWMGYILFIYFGRKLRTKLKKAR